MILRKLISSIILTTLFLLVCVNAPAKASVSGVLVYLTSNHVDDTTSLVIHDLITDEQQTIITHPSARGRNPVPPVVSLDGSIAYAAYTDDSYDIVVWQNDELTNLGEGFSPSWSADGRLAFVSEREGTREVYVWDGETTTRITNITVESGAEGVSYPDTPVWNADGLLAFQVQHTSSYWVYIWDGEALTNFEATYIVGNIAWSDDGRLAFRDRAGLQIWDNGTLTLIEVADVRRMLGDFAWSADGRLAFKIANDAPGNESEIYVWDDGIILKLGRIAYAYSPVWSSDGRLVFPSDRDGFYMDIYVWDDGTLTNISQSPEVHDIDPVWNSEGQVAFSTTNGSVYVWDGETTTSIGYGTAPQWMP